MGSQAIQAQLWGQAATDWSTFQEPTAKSGYDYALSILHLKDHDSLLDIGCGSGLFLSLAAPMVKSVTGFDATPELLGEARLRLPAAELLVGDMEALPFPDTSFDVVTGFNSFQYAASVGNALAEAYRVLKPRGRLVAMIWGNKEDCEASTSLKAVSSLLPPPPAGAPGPFALTEEQMLERMLSDTGFAVLQSKDVLSVWDYPNAATALRGLLSAGPAFKAIQHSGYGRVVEAVKSSFGPYTLPDGHIVYHNKWRVVLATRPG